MPVVPRYDAQVTPGISRATQNIQVSPDTFGAAKGRALQNVSQGLDIVAQRAEQIQNERDDVSAREAFISASGRLRERMRGEGGYLTRQGQDAFDGYNDFASEVDNIGSEFAQSLSPQARRAYEQLWANRREGALSSGATHAANQRNAYNQTVFEAQMAETRNNVIEEYGNPAVFSAYLESGADAVRARMNAQGIRDTSQEGRDTIAAAVDAWRSETVRMAVTSALDNGDLEMAERVFETNEELLVGADREAARALIRQEGMIEEHQAAAADIFAQFGTDVAGARRYIRENYSGQEEDQMLSRVEGLVSEREAEVRDAREAAAEELHALFIGGATIDDVPPSLRSVFFDLPERVQEAMLEGHAIYSDRDLIADLSGASVEELAQVEIPELMGRLTEEDFNRWSGYIRSAQGGQDAQGRAMQASYNDQMSEFLDRVEPLSGLSGNDRGRAIEERQRFQSYVDDLIAQEPTPPNSQRRREIMQEALADVTIRSSSWMGENSRAVPRYQLGGRGSSSENEVISGVPDWGVDIMVRVNNDLGYGDGAVNASVASRTFREIWTDFGVPPESATEQDIADFEAAYRASVGTRLVSDRFVSPTFTPQDRAAIAGEDEELQGQAAGIEAIEAFRRLGEED